MTGTQLRMRWWQGSVCCFTRINRFHRALILTSSTRNLCKLANWQMLMIVRTATRNTSSWHYNGRPRHTIYNMEFVANRIKYPASKSRAVNSRISAKWFPRAACPELYTNSHLINFINEQIIARVVTIRYAYNNAQLYAVLFTLRHHLC